MIVTARLYRHPFLEQIIFIGQLDSPSLSVSRAPSTTSPSTFRLYVGLPAVPPLAQSTLQSQPRLLFPALCDTLLDDRGCFETPRPDSWINATRHNHNDRYPVKPPPTVIVPRIFCSFFCIRVKRPCIIITNYPLSFVSRPRHCTFVQIQFVVNSADCSGLWLTKPKYVPLNHCNWYNMPENDAKDDWRQRRR